jgi:hypothetical protein
VSAPRPIEGKTYRRKELTRFAILSPGGHKPEQVHRDERDMQQDDRYEMKPASIDQERCVAAKGNQPQRDHASHIERQKDQRGRDIAREIDPVHG